MQTKEQIKEELRWRARRLLEDLGNEGVSRELNKWTEEMSRDRISGRKPRS